MGWPNRRIGWPCGGVTTHNQGFDGRPTCAGMRRSSTGSTRAGRTGKSLPRRPPLTKRSTALSTVARHVLRLGTGGHRCRRRGNGAAFSHGCSRKTHGLAPGSVRERTGAIISPRVGSRKADTFKHGPASRLPAPPRMGGEMRVPPSLAGQPRRGDWCWRKSSPRTSEAQIRGHMMRGCTGPRLAPLARPGRRGCGEGIGVGRWAS